MGTSTVLVTGATGFIAKHCIAELLRQGYRVRGTVRNLSRGSTQQASRSLPPISNATTAGTPRSPAAATSFMSPRHSPSSSQKSATR